MPLSDFLTGVAYAAGTIGSVGLATALIGRRRLPWLAGAPRMLATAIVFTALLIAVHLVPLALGILSRPAVLVASLLAALGAALLRPAVAAAAPAEPAPAQEAASSRLSWALAGAALALAAVEILAFLGHFATTSVTASDFTLFHLPGVARWIQSGTVWRNTAVIPDFGVGAYPNNGDLIFLAAVLPWRSDAFVRLTNFPFLALVGVSVYAIARELRAPRPTAALLGAVVVSVQTVIVTGLDRVKPETMMLAMLGAGVLFLVRQPRTRSRAELGLAGVGLGLAFGARWEGATAVVVIVLAWLLRSWLADHRVRPAEAVRLVGLILAAGGFWLVRNLVLFGNPVFPAKVAVLGATIFGAPYDYIGTHYDYTIADYLTNGAVLRHSILPAYRIAFGIPGALVAVGLLLAAAFAATGTRVRARWTVRSAALAGAGTAGGSALGGSGPRPRLARFDGLDRRLRGVVAALAASAAGILVVYLLTPGGAQGFRNAPWPGLPAENARWAAPALLIGGALTASVAGRLGRLRPALEAAGVVAVIDGIAQAGDVSGADRLLAAFALVALATLGAGAVVAWRQLRGRALARPLLAAALALGAVAAGALARWDQDRYATKRYTGIDPTIDWIRAHAPAGHRVGVAGAFSTGTGAQVLAMFGPRLRNGVAYVGYSDRGLLRQYHLGAAYQRALRRGRYDLVLVGRGAPPRNGTPAERWTRAAGFVAVARSQQWILFARPTLAS